VYKSKVAMSDYIRTQVLLERKQRIQLIKIAKDKGISFSELVRDFLNAQLRDHTYQEMRRAAEQLYTDYVNDEELKAMTALDGEDIIKG
jgi:hypothetical protein